jgi:hypothetical protein
MANLEKWLVLTTAPDQLTAEIWQDILVKEGIPAMVNPQDTISFLGVSTFPCRIMVAPGYLKQAQEILASLQAEGEADDKRG